MFVLCIWLIDLTVGEMKSSQIRQSGEHDIEFSTNPDLYHTQTQLIWRPYFVMHPGKRVLCETVILLYLLYC